MNGSLCRRSRMRTLLQASGVTRIGKQLTACVLCPHLKWPQLFVGVRSKSIEGHCVEFNATNFERCLLPLLLIFKVVYCATSPTCSLQVMICRQITGDVSIGCCGRAEHTMQGTINNTCCFTGFWVALSTRDLRTRDVLASHLIGRTLCCLVSGPYFRSEVHHNVPDSASRELLHFCTGGWFLCSATARWQSGPAPPGCPCCGRPPENEVNVVLECPVYADLRALSSPLFANLLSDPELAMFVLFTPPHFRCSSIPATTCQQRDFQEAGNITSCARRNRAQLSRHAAQPQGVARNNVPETIDKAEPF